MANTYENKYLDGVGLAHLWEKIKTQITNESAKIIQLTGWSKTPPYTITVTDSETKSLLTSTTQDVMLDDGGRRYYRAYWNGGTSWTWINGEDNSKIYKITLNVNSDYILTKTEVAYHAATADSATNATTATYATNVGSSGNSLGYNDLSNLNTNAVRATNTFKNSEIIIADGSTRNVKSSGMTFSELVKIAEGKTKAYVIGEFTSATDQGKAVLNDQFETNDDDIVLSIRSTKTEGSTTWAGFQDPSGNFVSLEDLKVGDIVLLKESNYPDRWVSYIDESKQAYATATFTSLEADKIDLTGYVTGSELTADTIILGNGNSGVKTSNATITSSITNNQSTWTNIPNIGAIINYVQPKLPTGTNGHILQLSNGIPTWANPSSLSVGSATTADKVANSLTFNSGGSGAASGTTYNGSAAKTISYNTIGAVNTATSTGAGTLWQATIIKNEATDTSSIAPTDPEINLTAKSKLVTGGGTAISITYDVNQELKVNKTGVILSSSRTSTSSSTKTEKYLTFNFNGFTYTKEGSTYKIVDTSMTLTPDDIDSIIKNLENNS